MASAVFGGGKLDGVRVLVVEDEPDSRELIVSLLEMCGATPYSASDGASGFAAFQRERPALVLTDLWMPGSNGYDLLRKVRELSPEEGGVTPIIAMTASAMDTEEKALGAGFHAHFSKPMDAMELVALLGSFADAAKEGGAPHPAARWTVSFPARDRVLVTYAGHVQGVDVRDSLTLAARHLEKEPGTIYMDALRVTGFEAAVAYAAQQAVWGVRDRIQRVVLATTSARVRLFATAACGIVGVSVEFVEELPAAARS